MNSNFKADFSVDRENKTITVTHDFAAAVAKVWAAWTQAELLDQWWAPKPWRAETSHIDFRNGGYWLYAMIGPEGDKQFCRADYSNINEQKSYSASDAFCDEKGNVDESFPQAMWQHSFTAGDGSTNVRIVITYKELADLEKIVEMGFVEGFTAGLNNLDELLAAAA